ncbi:hypothetical protein CEXT_271521 [Caerostris extrusa]|uniref:Uncharacterized protein n=1 Tax=Caerostris extrusa TaxID=172846 RepID=A0AAV4RS77_CAEEX|nr:hypothetical protein CEXT_271521 [Caerostris extrusa]
MDTNTLKLSFSLSWLVESSVLGQCGTDRDLLCGMRKISLFGKSVGCMLAFRLFGVKVCGGGESFFWDIQWCVKEELQTSRASLVLFRSTNNYAAIASLNLKAPIVAILKLTHQLGICMLSVIRVIRVTHFIRLGLKSPLQKGIPIRDPCPWKSSRKTFFPPLPIEENKAVPLKKCFSKQNTKKHKKFW